MADVRARMRAAQMQRAAAAAAGGAAENSTAAKETATGRIASPWVRYNALGQPACTVCFVTLKNDILWAPHAASKKHKDAVAAALSERAQAPGAPPPPARAEATPTTTPTSALGALAGYADDAADGDDVLSLPHPTATGMRIVDDEVVEEEKEDDDDDDAATRPEAPGLASAPGAATKAEPPSVWARVAEEATRVRMDSLPALPLKRATADGAAEEDGEPAGPLPADFFDAEGGAAQPKKKKKAAADGSDDVDKEEWERFRRAIHRETAVSAQMQEADLVEMMQDRDERLEYEHELLKERLAALRARKEALVPGPRELPPAADEDDEDDEDDVDPDDLFNWRSKGV